MIEEIPSLSFFITTTIKDIQKSDWDRLFEKNTVEGYGYHKTIEQAGLQEFRIGYLLAKRGQKIVGIIPFFIMDFSLESLMNGFLNKLFFIFKPFLRMKMMFLGSPTTEEFYFGISKDENLTVFFDSAFETLRKLSKKDKINSIVFNNISDKNTPLTEYLKKRDFIRMETLPTTLIDIEADSLEAYIKKLSKNTRKDLKRKLNKSSQAAELITKVYDNIDAICARVYELYLNNFTGSDIHFEKLTFDFFKNICQNMPGAAKFFITFDQDKIVAFNLCLVENNLCIDKFIGFDSQTAHKYSLYFTTFCHNIDWCIKNGINYYQPGTTDYYPKMRLGAKLIPLYIYAKSFNPIVNLVVKLISPLIEPKNLDPSWKEYLRQKKLSRKESY